MMLNRTLFLSVIAAAFAALFFFSTFSFATAAEERTFFSIDNGVILGQSQNDTRRSPTLGSQFRQWLSRMLPDDAPDNSNHNNNNNQRQGQPATTPAVPVQPPKPPTASEVQQSTTSNQSQPRTAANTGNTPQPRAGAAPSARDSVNDVSNETEIFVRMHELRRPVFADHDLEKIAQQTRQMQAQRPLAPAPPPAYSNVVDDPRDFAGLPTITRTPGVPPVPTAEKQEIFVPINFDPQSPINQIPDPFPPRELVQPVQPSAQPQVQPPPAQPPVQTGVQPPSQPTNRQMVVEPEQRREPTSQYLVSASPRLEFEIQKPPSAIVGQEILYRIRARNVGNSPAERVVLQVEVPPWINIRHTDADNGNWVLQPRGDGSGVVDLKWEVNRINSGETNLLALWLIPQQHRSIELPMQYDFHRPAIISTVEVQNPQLAMELIGPDEVRWNDPVIYTLVVRNIGNGSAEKLRFELSQTSSEARATTMEEPLLPGEGQEIPIMVQAGREQEQIDIAVVATGAHDLKSEVRRRIRVLRPRLEMSVQTPSLHFVDEPAEMLIRVVNHGNADAENVTIRAELPLGAQHVSSSDGGLFVQQQQQNIVEWRGRSIGKGEMQTFSMICIPRREGECRVSVAASEANGSMLTFGNGMFTAEAVVELDLAVHRPHGPIEQGQEVTYTVEVTNIGTKAAENVEISMMFDDRLEPTAVAGRDAHYTGDGQVIFEKIPAILPKQCITLKVSVEAKGTGTAQVRAEVVRVDSSGSRIRLEQGLSANIFGSRQREAQREAGQRDAATASGQSTQNEFVR